MGARWVTETFLHASLFTLALAGCVTAANAGVGPSVQGGGWVEVRTPHLRVLSDAGLGKATAIAERLERLHEVLGNSARTLVVEPRRPRVVLLFADEDGFFHYRPFYRGSRELIRGYFQPTPDGEFLIMQSLSGEERAEVAVHEYTHAILHEAMPQIPMWLNEGLAEYFSTFRVDSRTAQMGAVISGHLQHLQSAQLLTIPELFAVNPGSGDYHEGERQGTFYAESWLLVHMLLSERAEDLPRLEGFLRAMRDGADPHTAFRREYGEDTALQMRLGAYARRTSFGAREWHFDKPFGAIDKQIRMSVPTVELLTTIAMALIPQGKSMWPTVSQHLTAALSLSPHDPTACALAGVLAEKRGEHAAAERWYTQALAAPDVPASVCRQVANSRMSVILEPPPGATHGSAGSQEAVQERVTEIRAVVERGLRREPADAELLALLAKTYVVAPGPDAGPGLRAAEQASHLLPGRTDLIADRVVLLAFQGQLGDARRLFEERVIPLAKPFEADYARVALEDLEGRHLQNAEVDRFNAAVDLVNRGQRRAAAAAFDSVASGHGSAELRERAADAARKLHADETDAAEGARAVKRYNEGVTATTKGDWATATEAFRDALTLAPTEELRTQARAALERVETERGFVRVNEHLRATRYSEAETLLRSLRRRAMSPAQKAWVDRVLRDLAARRAQR